MIYDLLYCLDLSETGKILWVSGGDPDESQETISLDRLCQVNYFEPNLIHSQDCEVCFYDLPKADRSGDMASLSPQRFESEGIRERIIWQLNGGFWASKVVAPVFNLKDRKFLTPGYISSYRKLIPESPSALETVQCFFVYRFNEDALMLSETDLFLSRFEVWSGNSGRNRLVAFFLQFKPIRLFVKNHWPFRIILQKPVATLSE